MTIKELIEKRAKVWETAKNFVDSHEDENGILSAEDEQAYAKMGKELDDLTAAIDRKRAIEEREANLVKPVSEPIVSHLEKMRNKTGRASSDCIEDFSAHLRGKPLVHNVLSEDIQADGGYLVPE